MQTVGVLRTPIAARLQLLCVGDKQVTFKRRRISGRDGVVWRGHSKKWRDQLGMEMESEPYTANHKMVGLPLTPRVKDNVDVTWTAMKKRGVVFEDVTMDVSLEVNRAVRTNTLKTPMISTGTILYNFGLDRIHVGEENGFLLGYGATKKVKQKFMEGTRNLEDSQVTDLIGNTMALPHVALVLAIGLMCIDDLWVP